MPPPHSPSRKTRATFAELLLSLIVAVSAICASHDSDELIFAQAVWRHGERSPEHLIPTDTANNASTWPNGLGQLTTEGMVQQFLLGHKLRRRYVVELALVSEVYRSGEVYARSSDSDRTLMSAASNMIGFYAADADARRVSKLHEEARQHSSMGADGAHGGVRTTIKDTAGLYPTVNGWPGAFVPVPVHTVARSTDQLPNTDAPCPRRDAITDLIDDSREFRQLANESQEFLDEFSRNCGDNVTLQNIWRYADTIYVEECANRTLPAWMTAEVRQRVVEIDQAVTALYYSVNGAPTIDNLPDNLDIEMEVARLRGGPLLSAMVDNFQSKANCEDTRNTVRGQLLPGKCAKINALKYYVFSMHDVTLRALYMALGLHNVSGISPVVNPPYATAFTLELWQRAQNTSTPQPDDKYYIKLLHWPPDRSIDDAKPYVDITDRISDCGTNGDDCTLAAFTSRSLPYRPQPNMPTLCADTGSLLGATAGVDSSLHFHWSLAIPLLVLISEDIFRRFFIL